MPVVVPTKMTIAGMAKREFDAHPKWRVDSGARSATKSIAVLRCRDRLFAWRSRQLTESERPASWRSPVSEATTHGVRPRLTHAATHANPVPTRVPTRILKGSDGPRRNPADSAPANLLGNSKRLARPTGFEPVAFGS